MTDLTNADCGPLYHELMEENQRLREKNKWLTQANTLLIKECDALKEASGE